MEPNMQNKKHGKNSWSDKLEDTTSLPALLLEDKNAAWEKLHTRLQQKLRRSNSLWYWAAAACILLLCTRPILFTNEKTGAEEKGLVHSIANDPASQTIATPEKKNMMSAQALTTPENVTSIVKHGATHNNSMHRDELEKQVNPVSGVSVHQEITAAVVTGSPVENTIPEALVAVTVPVKPTLRVVHINELEGALPQSNTARINDDGFIKFKIINQQVNSRTPATAKTLSFNISKFTTTN